MLAHSSYFSKINILLRFRVCHIRSPRELLLSCDEASFRFVSEPEPEFLWNVSLPLLSALQVDVCQRLLLTESCFVLCARPKPSHHHFPAFSKFQQRRWNPLNSRPISAPFTHSSFVSAERLTGGITSRLYHRHHPQTKQTKKPINTQNTRTLARLFSAVI